jgi:ankyrin repeat protein
MSLLWAAFTGHEAIVNLLLDKNAAIEPKDKEYAGQPRHHSRELVHKK